MTNESQMHQIDRLLSHVWMVRTFLKHSEEAEEDDELREGNILNKHPLIDNRKASTRRFVWLLKLVCINKSKCSIYLAKKRRRYSYKGTLLAKYIAEKGGMGEFYALAYTNTAEEPLVAK